MHIDLTKKKQKAKKIATILLAGGAAMFTNGLVSNLRIGGNDILKNL
jgi:hypothetical protein